MVFDIPPQPLSRALAAYGATTGLELYYNAALAEGRRSVAVTGTLPPTLALQTLLRGTGLVPQMTGPDTFTIVPAPREAVPPATATNATRDRYEPYFAAIQARIVEALGHGAGVGLKRDSILLRFWLAPSGVISRAEVLGADGDRADGLIFAHAIQGMEIGAAPPPGMPQPVTLVIFLSSAASKESASIEGAN